MIIATRPAHQPLSSHCCQRQRRKRYKRSLNRQCYPLHFMRECIPPNLHDPQRAKGSLDRRSKRLSFPHFFLRRKKCGRRRPPPRQGETDSPPRRRNPPRAKGSLNRRFEWLSLVTFFLQKKKVTRAEARNAPSRARHFLIRCRSPDCTNTAFRCRCRCRLLWQKSLLYRITALKYSIPCAQRAHLPLPPCGGKGAI